MLNFSINHPSFNGLVSLGKRILNTSEDVVQIKTQFFRPYCIAYLDQLLSCTDQKIYLYSKYPKLNQYLKQIRFPFFAKESVCSNPFPEEWMITLKRFMGDLDVLAEEVPAWLEQEVIAKNYLPEFSPKLGKEIIENLWEIVNNAVQHSDSSNGISCCGQFYPQMGYFEIAFYDHGVGIPFRIKNFFQSFQNYSDYDFIEWALEKGNTTRPDLESGGTGLYSLREFLKLNGGWLQIISHSGIYQAEGEHQHNAFHLKNQFKGTLFNIRIIYDRKLYCFEGEEL